MFPYPSGAGSLTPSEQYALDTGNDPRNLLSKIFKRLNVKFKN